LTVVRRILRIKIVKSVEISHDIVQNFVDDFQRIGKNSLSKDHNASQHVFSKLVVSKMKRKHLFLQETYHLLKYNAKNIRNYSHRQDSLDTGSPTYLWEFSRRLPRFDMNLVGEVKGLVQDFLHENTRPSSNQMDVLKLRRGSRDCESHIKKYLEITPNSFMIYS